ncbi:pyridoxal phosphate-dependent aminotransferase [Parasediminibacterium paludis]|uniref:Aminotransferase n=1 Tax=Parasediminibacterium paludis TaxID=908966 RepID=A0ABV8PW28_9BACT
MFNQSAINFTVLRERAFNLRWASVPSDVIPLTAADPDFPCAPEIAEAIAKYASSRYFSYAPAEGYSFFKEAMANWQNKHRQVPAKAAYLYPVDTAAFGIYNVCKAFLSIGDEAIIFDPVDFLFRYSIETCNAKAVPFSVPLNPETAFDYDALEQLITPNTKMLCLCNPLNPTGKVFTRQELEAIGAIAVKHSLIILSDEIWSDIVFTPHQYVSVAALDEAIRKQTVIVTGFSKSYALAGLRIGVVIAFSEPHYQLLMQASNHQSTIHGSNVFGQVAAATALNDCGYWLSAFITHLQKVRNICVNGLNAIEGVSCFMPQGCYLAFANIEKTGLNSSAMHELLLHKAKVAVVPGLPKWFGEGAAGHIRLSFATSEELVTKAIARINKTISESI